MANEESSNSVYNSIDEILLIELVKNRSVLWDSTEDNYRKKVSCDAAWEEVCKNLFTRFELYDNERKISLTRDVKKKWTNLRDCYNKSRKVGKESVSKYKSLDFLSKVYDEKEKKSSLFVSPSKEKNSTPVAVADLDADTQVNSSLQNRRDKLSCSQTGIRATRDRTLFADYFTEPARPEAGVNSLNMKEECDSPKSDSDSDSDDEDAKDVKPQCSTTSNGGESSQSNVRSGVKRRLEENKEEDGDEHFLQFVKKSLIKNFNSSQTKRFRSEIIQLLDSVGNEFDDAEIEIFNTEILKVLLSIKNLNKTKDIYKKIIGCVEEAEKEREG